MRTITNLKLKTNKDFHSKSQTHSVFYLRQKNMSFPHIPYLLSPHIPYLHSLAYNNCLGGSNSVDEADLISPSDPDTSQAGNLPTCPPDA
jgi:hypothetical protein